MASSGVSVMRAQSAEIGVTTADSQNPPIPKPRPEVRGLTAAGGDTLVGKRLRKSFGSRFFWGAVVGSYVIAEAQFYKIRFDDGDVDILAAAEVLEDVKQAREKRARFNTLPAEKYALEDKLPSTARTVVSGGCQHPSHESPIYQDELRHMTLKRKRDEPLDPALYESISVTVWEERLYVSIITSNKVTTVSEFVKRSDGRLGEVEATGQVRVGDIISQINGHHIAGLDSASVSGMIKSARRPLVIVFLRPRVGHQPQERASRADDVRENESHAEAQETVENVGQNHRAAATGVAPAANAVHITNLNSTSSAQPTAEATPTVDAPVSAHQSAHPAHPEAEQHSQLYRAPSYQTERQSAPAHAYSNPPVPAPQQRYPQQQQSQIYNNSQYVRQQTVSQPPMQPYPAAATATQATYNALSDPQQSLRVNLVFRKQQRTATQNQWNSVYGRQQVPPATAYGTSMMPVAHRTNSSNYHPYLAGGRVPTSHLRPQYQAPQATHPQELVASQQHPDAMLHQHPQQQQQQQAQPTRNQWTIANGVIVGTLSASDYGNNVCNSRSSTAAPAKTRTSEYDNNRSRSNVVDFQSTQPAAASVTVQGMMPAHQYASSSSSSQQQPQPEGDAYYNSAATESSEPDFSTSESRFTEVDPSQGQQSAGTAAPEVEDDGTESDEPPDYYEPAGRFVLDDDLDDDEKQLAAELGVDVSQSTNSVPAKSSSSFLSASSVAAAAAVEPVTETEEAASFLSPNKPNSFVATIPVQTIDSHQYAQPQSQPQPQPSHELETTLKTVNGEECVVVEIKRTRLYVTLGQLGTWIAITSFVRGKNGEMGEIEESGKVFIGDTIYAINGYSVNMEASPTDVARVVTNLPRPFKLYFQRATWDTLEGNT